MNKRRWIWAGTAFVIFIASYFLGGPALQGLMEKHQPYLIVDPDVKSETGCGYDYLTYLPVEATGLDPSEGVVFPVTEIPVVFAEYVHYPDSWNNPLNPFNPENEFSSTIELVGKILVGILLVAFFVYIAILWRRGKLRKMADKLRE